jgi:hypothetical protein
MPNPLAPTDSAGRRIPFVVDPDNPGTAYLAAGEGGIDMGAGRTEGAAAYVVPVKSDTATRTSVAGAEADTLILAANSGRRGAIVYNEGTVVLYLALGDYTVAVAADTAYDVPSGYVGEVRGIWDTIGSGDDAAAKVTELTTEAWAGS